MYLGIDVSNNNGHIYWPQVAESAVDHATIKASEGTYYHDEFFALNVVQARAAGLAIAPYHFGRPSANTGHDEAVYFWYTVGQRGPYQRYMLDIEDNRVKPGADLGAYLVDFYETWRDLAGTRLLLYTSFGYAQDHHILGNDTLAGFDLYIAAWQVVTPSSFEPWQEWQGWQFTAEGYTPGAGVVSQSLWKHTWWTPEAAKKR